MNKNKVNHELMMQLDRVGSVIAVHEGVFPGGIIIPFVKVSVKFLKISNKGKSQFKSSAEVKTCINYAIFEIILS